jgi:hypothetical protein
VALRYDGVFKASGVRKNFFLVGGSGLSEGVSLLWTAAALEPI